MLQTHWHAMPHDSIFFKFVTLFTSNTLELATKLSTLSPKLHINKFNHFQFFLGLIGDQGMESSISIDHSLIIKGSTMRNVECMHCINNMIHTHTQLRHVNMIYISIFLYFFVITKVKFFNLWNFGHFFQILIIENPKFHFFFTL